MGTDPMMPAKPRFVETKTETFSEAAPKLLRDPLVVKVFRRRYKDDAAGRMQRIAERKRVEVDEYDFLADILGNDARLYVRFWSEGSFGRYPIEIKGLGGVYFVKAPDFDEEGYFCSISDAVQYVFCNWMGQRLSGGRYFREPFEAASTRRGSNRRGTNR